MWSSLPATIQLFQKTFRHCLMFGLEQLLPTKESTLTATYQVLQITYKV